MTKTRLAVWLGGPSVLAFLAAGVVVHEGEILKSYRDPIGIWTACVGETDFVVKPGDIKPGARFTKEQCTERLYLSLAKHAEPVIRCTAPAVLTTGQKVAYVSFAFNVGESAFCNSTLARKARAGDVVGSCNELSRWTMAGGKELPGLVKRRAGELHVCLNGVPVTTEGGYVQ
jgi:lysozyme